MIFLRTLCTTDLKVIRYLISLHQMTRSLRLAPRGLCRTLAWFRWLWKARPGFLSRMPSKWAASCCCATSSLALSRNRTSRCDSRTRSIMGRPVSGPERFARRGQTARKCRNVPDHQATRGLKRKFEVYQCNLSVNSRLFEDTALFSSKSSCSKDGNAWKSSRCRWTR